MSLVKAIKARVSPTDRTLAKHGYLDGRGERTSQYEDELWQAIRERMIDAEDTAEFRKELAAGLRDEDEDAE